MKYIIFALLIASFPVFSIINTDIISGRVTDSSDGRPVTGATVMWKGTSSGVVTDAEGKFSIKTSEKSTTLVITMVGYETQEIKIKSDSKPLEIKLRVMALNL